MVSTCHYDAPLGGILLAADEIGLTGLWFDGEKYFADNLPAERTQGETPILLEAVRWLDIYFAGREPDFLPPLPMARSRESLPQSRDVPGCLRRRSAARWDITKFLSSFPATASLARTGVSPDTPGELTKK